MCVCVCLVRCRDQGFTRPTVLIITPFRNAAHEIVELMAKHAPTPVATEIANQARFEEEFSGEKQFAVDRPADFLDAFQGNTDDSYKIGVSFLRKTLKLYAPFYKADMIIGSPLGLKLVVGAKGYVADAAHYWRETWDADAGGCNCGSVMNAAACFARAWVSVF